MDDPSKVYRRIYTGKLNTATSCAEVYATSGDPAGVYPPRVPNGCYSSSGNYYAIWVIPDTNCATYGFTYEWSTPEVISCEGSKLKLEADLDLQNYDTVYWEAIEKTTPLVYQGDVSYPVDTSSDTGFFEVENATCQQTGTYWTNSNGEPGYDNLGCVGHTGNQNLTMYRAYLTGIDNISENPDTWCNIVRTTPGKPNGVYSFPTGCEIEGNKAYGIWVLGSTITNLPPTPNPVCGSELIWTYVERQCVNGTTKFIARLDGYPSDLTESQQLAIARVVPFAPPGSISTRTPVDVYIRNCKVFGMWNGGSCTTSTDPEFIIIVMILLLAFLVLLFYVAFKYL